MSKCYGCKYRFTESDEVVYDICLKCRRGFREGTEAYESRGDKYEWKVSGSLSSVFGDILPTDKDRTEFESLIIGKPIKNENDRVIGKITDILWDEDLWIGEVYVQLKFENDASVTITCSREEEEETSNDI